MDEELKRIEEEIRKSREKRQALEARKGRRLKEIREKQERDRKAWLKRMSTCLDQTLTEMEGKTYFYQVSQQQVTEAVKRGGIAPAPASAEKGKSEKADKEENR